MMTWNPRVITFMCNRNGPKTCTFCCSSWINDFFLGYRENERRSTHWAPPAGGEAVRRPSGGQLRFGTVHRQPFLSWLFLTSESSHTRHQHTMNAQGRTYSTASKSQFYNSGQVTDSLSLHALSYKIGIMTPISHRIVLKIKWDTT